MSAGDGGPGAAAGHLLGVWEADEVLQTDTFSAGRTLGGNR